MSDREEQGDMSAEHLCAGTAGSTLPEGAASPQPVAQRWMVLLCFSTLTLLNCMSWIQFAPITDAVQAEYGISSLYVDALSMIFMLTYIPLAFPAMRVTEQFGLLGGIRAGAFFTAAGAWVRVASVGPRSYALLLAGQTVISLGQLPLLGAPPRLSLTWFPDSQWALATSIAVLANQAGGAVAYVVSPRLVASGGAGLGDYLAAHAAVCTAVGLLVAAAVPPHPPHPASWASVVAAARQASGGGKGGKGGYKGGGGGTTGDGGSDGGGDGGGGGEGSTWASFAQATRDDLASFALAGRGGGGLLCAAYGIAVGCSYAVSTELAGMLVPLRATDTTVGWVGFSITTVGLAGSVLAGLALDASRLHRPVLVGLTLASCASLAALALAVAGGSLPGVFAAAGSFGFCLTGVLPVGFEYAVELAFPIPEDLVATALNVVAQAAGIALILAGSALGSPRALWALVVALALATLLATSVRGDMKRQRVQAEGHDRRPSDEDQERLAAGLEAASPMHG